MIDESEYSVFLFHPYNVWCHLLTVCLYDCCLVPLRHQLQDFYYHPREFII
jgi:hypothetical protein